MKKKLIYKKMKVLNPNFDFAQRLEKVFECMEENNIRIDYACGEFRVSDTSTDNTCLQNMPLVDIDGQTIPSLPAPFEYRLSIFNS